MKVQPEAISIGLFLIGNPWSRNFASIEQLAMELDSIEITRNGLVESIVSGGMRSMLLLLSQMIIYVRLMAL
ncbi:MAG: hypothetical protein V7K53_24390 [Nostoc sp.]|uniref:hypothetical protein n=1 Tax=Nostoc sp. TaxID=1180 RepID=UPI002FF96AF4